jgi:hypothetical protein
VILRTRIATAPEPDLPGADHVHLPVATELISRTAYRWNSLILASSNAHLLALR